MDKLQNQTAAAFMPFMSLALQHSDLEAPQKTYILLVFWDRFFPGLGQGHRDWMSHIPRTFFGPYGYSHQQLWDGFFGFWVLISVISQFGYCSSLDFRMSVRICFFHLSLVFWFKKCILLVSIFCLWVLPCKVSELGISITMFGH